MNNKIAGLAPLFLLALSACCTLISACSSLSSSKPLFAEAHSAGMVYRKIAVEGFVITAIARLQDANKPIHLYIEGDGKAWISRNEPSADPTPINPLGLRLALQDSFANVVYIARPCQFNLNESPACRQALWTSGRFSVEVLTAMSAAINKLKAEHSDQRLELIGYSGGAAIAVLLASRRNDVISLRSVAGNLDHVAFNRYHKVSAMPQSLNPIDIASDLHALPQIHFTGAEDNIVPPFIAQSFALKAGRCSRTKIVAKAGHEKGWVEAWPMLLAEAPTCRPAN